MSVCKTNLNKYNIIFQHMIGGMPKIDEIYECICWEQALETKICLTGVKKQACYSSS